jgi:hypothetical protein
MLTICKKEKCVNFRNYEVKYGCLTPIDGASNKSHLCVYCKEFNPLDLYSEDPSLSAPAIPEETVPAGSDLEPNVSPAADDTKNNTDVDPVKEPAPAEPESVTIEPIGDSELSDDELRLRVLEIAPDVEGVEDMGREELIKLLTPSEG